MQHEDQDILMNRANVVTIDARPAPLEAPSMKARDSQRSDIGHWNPREREEHVQHRGYGRNRMPIAQGLLWIH